MNVTFLLASGDGRMLTEADLSAAGMQREKGCLAALEALEGAIRIEHAALEPLEIRDQLDVLVIKLCIRSQAPLAAGKSLQVPMYTYNRQIELRAEGAATKIVDIDGKEHGPYPTAELAKALAGVGARFLEFVERLNGLNPSWDDVLQWLRDESKSHPVAQH